MEYKLKKGLIYLSFLGMLLGITAFQCSSAELTGAKLYINQKQFDKAKEALLKEVEKNPASDEGWFLLGSLYGDEGDFVKMFESFDKSLAASKKFEQQIVEARKYYWATSFNKGVGYFNQATKTTNQDSVIIFYDKAIDEFNKSILCEPDSVSTYSNIVYAYFNTNRTEQAVEPLKKLVAAGNAPEAFTLLGQIYTNKGTALMSEYKTSKIEADSLKAIEQFNEAIELLEKGRQLFPEDSDILLQLSNAYIGADKLDVAMTAFKAGVESEPDNKYYHYNYGVLLLNANDYEGAKQQFKDAVSIDPDYINAVYNLAVTYIRWGTKMREEMEEKGESNDLFKEKFQLAIPYLEQYLSVNPNESSIWDLLGRVYANLGMEEKSIEAFKKADESK